MFLKSRWSALLLLVLAIVALTTAAQAQEDVTYDEVNAIAARMFCPECEYIPLDKCFTEVCVQWKQDIADQLAAGRTSQQIVDDFVARFGDQVIGVPQDPVLRAITLTMPWILAAGFAAFGWYTYSRLRASNLAAAQQAPASPDATLDAYRQRVERDLHE